MSSKKAKLLGCMEMVCPSENLATYRAIVEYSVSGMPKDERTHGLGQNVSA